MILGVNGIRLLGPRSGVGRAIEAILRCMGDLGHPFHEIRVYTPAPLDPEIALPRAARNVVVRSPLPPMLWEQLSLWRAHDPGAPLFCPSYVMPLLARCPTLVVHHGSYEGYPGAHRVFSRWRRLKARLGYQLSARRATLLSTVSHHSKADVVRYYRLRADRVHVIPEGVDTRLFRPLHDPARLAAWRRRVLGADVPCLLYVGKPTPRRHLPDLLRAFATLVRERALPHKLLLVGTALPGIPVAPLVDALGLASDVVTVGYASHEELVLAYNASTLLVYPSAYEGFGLPVLEAMACGTPVLALDNTAVPEFAGGVARLLPDAAVDRLAAAIAELVADGPARARMAEAGPRRAAQYDWHRITSRYLDLLEELAAPTAAPRRSA